MKSRRIFWISLVAFGVLLTVMVVLYNSLKNNVNKDNLIIYERSQNEHDLSSDAGKPSEEGVTEGDMSNGENVVENVTEGDENEDAIINGESVGENVNNEDVTEQESNGENEEIELAPDFTVYDKDGQPVRLSDFRGKPVVLNFWASWCGPCQSEMPDFQDKYLELGDDVHFLMVNLTDGRRETVEGALSFVNKKGYTFPILFDTEDQAATVYRVYSIPTTYFIGAKGNIIAQANGAIDAETLQRGIDLIM